MIRDGWYEGYSYGLPGSQAPSEKVPYGCWFRNSADSGIYINLGVNPLFDTKLNLQTIFNDGFDKYFCTEAIKRGYSSIIAYGSPYYTEYILCYGGCLTETFNTTCPPNIDLLQNKHFSSIPCNCSDDDSILNCNHSYNDSISRSSNYEVVFTPGKKLCVMNSIDFPPRLIHANSSISVPPINMTFLLTFNLLRTKKENHHHGLLNSIDYLLNGVNRDSILVLNLESMDSEYMSSRSTFNKRLDELNLETTFILSPHPAPMNKIESLTIENNNKIKLFSNIFSFDNQEMLSFQTISIGIIHHSQQQPSFSDTSSFIKFVISQTVCLRTLGASIIILLSFQPFQRSKQLITLLHDHVDLLLSVNNENVNDEFSCNNFYDNVDCLKSEKALDRLLHISSHDSIGVLNYLKASIERPSIRSFILKEI